MNTVPINGLVVTTSLNKFQLYLTPIKEGHQYLIFQGKPDIKKEGHNEGKDWYASHINDKKEINDRILDLKDYYKETGHSIDEVNWDVIELKEKYETS